MLIADRRSWGGLAGREGPVWFLGGLAVGAVLLGLVWATVAYAGGGSAADGGSSGPPSPAAAPAAPAAPDEPATSPTRVERCARAADTLAAPLRAARPAMDQWAVHVGAMNKLVTGALTLQQANAFWNRTRVAAGQHIADFRRAVDRMKQHGVDCPAPGTVQSAPALRACERGVAADLTVLRTARSAVATWKQHVRDMERLRAGKLSPTRATRMWLAMWKRGDHQIQRYDAAVRDARQAPSCGERGRGGGSGGSGHMHGMG